VVVYGRDLSAGRGRRTRRSWAKEAANRSIQFGRRSLRNSFVAGPVQGVGGGEGKAYRLSDVCVRVCVCVWEEGGRNDSKKGSNDRTWTGIPSEWPTRAF